MTVPFMYNFRSVRHKFPTIFWCSIFHIALPRLGVRIKKNLFISMASHLASLWNRGLVQLGNDLFATLRLRNRLGRGGCQSALWDCSGGRIFNVAANSNEDANAEEEMKLQEIDVLGWELLKPTQCCTVSILKRWLACRGAKLFGKRLIACAPTKLNSG